MVAVPNCPILTPQDVALLDGLRQIRTQDSPCVSPFGSESAGAYARPGDLLRYTVRTTLSSVGVTFAGRFVSPQLVWTPYTEVIAGSSTGAPQTLTTFAAEGYYSNVVAQITSGTATGTEVFVLVELGRIIGGTFVTLAILLSGYVTSNIPIDSHNTGPTASQTGVTSGGGGTSSCVCPSTFEIRNINGIESAQGALVNFTPAANTVERVWSIYCSADLSGVGTGRGLFGEVVVVGAGPVLEIFTPETVPSGNFPTLTGLVDLGENHDGTYDFLRKMPAALWFSQEYQVQVGILNFQTGDSLVSYYAIIEVRS